MRKIDSSGKTSCKVAFSALAEARSRPNGFSKTTARRRGAAGALQLLDHRAEHRGRDGQVVRGQLRAAQRCLQLRERVGVGVVAVDVAQLLGENRERVRVESAVLGAARLGALDQLLERVVRLGDADDRKVQDAALGHALQRGEDLLVGEVAGRAEEDQRVGPRFGVAHGTPG